MSSTEAFRFRTRPNVASATRRRQSRKAVVADESDLADAGADAFAVPEPRAVEEKCAGSIDAECSVCGVVVATDSALANSSFGVVCSECGAIVDSNSSKSSSLLVHHLDSISSSSEGSSLSGQWVSKSVGARGLGVTSQLLADTTSGSNRTVSARQRVQQRVTLFLSQLRLPSAALRAAVLSLVEAVVGGRYGNGSSRWLELVCMACVYVSHRQHQTLTVAEGERQLLLTSELSTLIGMDERLIVTMAGRIQRQHVRPYSVPPGGGEYVPQLIAVVLWRDGGSKSELLSRQRVVQQKAQRVLDIAHKLDMQYARSAVVLSAAAVSLILLHSPYCDYHSHPVRLISSVPSSPSLLSALSSRAGVSERTVRSSQRRLETVIRRALLPLSSAPLIQPLPRKRKRGLVSVCDPSVPSLSLLLQQLDVVETCVPTAESNEADSSSGAEVRVQLAEESSSDVWTEVGGDEDFSQYIRSEEEMVELQQLEYT